MLEILVSYTVYTKAILWAENVFQLMVLQYLRFSKSSFTGVDNNIQETASS